MHASSQTEGVILIDHGSRRAESNLALLDMVAVYRRHSGRKIVEPAHMELACPSLSEAFAACVGQGAQRIIVFPFFLSPGRHWHDDIPRLAAEAAQRYEGVSFLVAAPLGVHWLLAELIEQRIRHCQSQAETGDGECEICQTSGRCQYRTVPP